MPGNTRSLAEDPIVRLILDGTVVRVRLDRKATSISLLVVLGVRADGQKVLLAIKSMGGESAEAWRTVLDDLIKRGLRRPEFLIVDGAPGLDKAIASVWDGVPVQCCTVHKLRNLIAHAPERLHDEITADYNDMIYATTPRRSRSAARPSSENGGSSTALSPTASMRQETACSPSRACRRANGAACAPPTLSSVCTRNSSDGSRPKPFCRQPTPLRCCSGRCWPQDRSTCARSMVGRPSPQNQSICRLTLLPETILSCSRRMRQTEFQPHSGRHLLARV